MDALISGQAGVALLIQGNEVSTLGSESDRKEYPSSFACVPYVLAGASDVVQVQGTTRSDVVRRLKSAWSSDRALQTFLILLDASETVDNRQLSAECLSELFEDNQVLEFVANRLYAAPLPPESDVLAGLSFAKGDEVRKFLEEIREDQALIERITEVWDGLSPSLFETESAKREFREAAIACGAFRQIARSSADPASFGMTTIQCHVKLSTLPNSRLVLRSWLGPLKPGRGRLPAAPQIPELGKARVRDGSDWHQRQTKISGHELFENVKKQKHAIVELMQKGDIARVRSYVGQLVESQLKSGGAQYAAMSLCDLAQQAKGIRNYSLQLELSQKAASIAPEDGWAHGQVADAYVCLGQYDNALKSFELAATFGEVVFASTGRARILRVKGQLNEALKAFEEIIQFYPDEMSAWLGRAEVLRDMWRLDDALGAYEAAVGKFPYEPIPRCGRAAVLKDMGRLHEALAAYEEAARDFTNEYVPLCGRADILKELGRLDLALTAYSEAIEKFPTEPVARCGYAEVLKLAGKLDEALEKYADAVTAFPYEVVPYSGRAETLKAMRKYDEALQSYDEALQRFPYEVKLLNGKADVLKRLGRLRDSLRAYDEIIRLFPYDLFALTGRADLLKELGELKEAVAAYDVLMKRHTAGQGIRNAKAAVLAALGHYEKALELLPAGDVQTRDEWIGQHIRGTIFMRRGRLDLAINLFENSLTTIPFAMERSYFENALAVAKLRMKRFDQAIDHLSKRPEPLSTLLRMHAFAALERLDEAKDALKQVEFSCPRNLVRLKNELAARYKLSSKPPKHTVQWVFDQECQNLLLEAA